MVQYQAYNTLLDRVGIRAYAKSMAFEEKFTFLDEETKAQIIAMANEIGAWKTAEKWAESVGMSVAGLYKSLKGKVTPKAGSQVNRPVVEKPKERRLTEDEKRFLKQLKTGEASLDEASRFVAVRTFEQMLKNPDQFRFIDFFRTELLKIKRDEVGIKETWAKELIGRMFAGKLPPPNCPNCGHPFMESKIEEGEVIHGNGKLS